MWKDKEMGSLLALFGQEQFLSSVDISDLLECNLLGAPCQPIFHIVIFLKID